MGKPIVLLLILGLIVPNIFAMSIAVEEIIKERPKILSQLDIANSEEPSDFWNFNPNADLMTEESTVPRSSDQKATVLPEEANKSQTKTKKGTLGALEKILNQMEGALKKMRSTLPSGRMLAAGGANEEEVIQNTEMVLPPSPSETTTTNTEKQNEDDIANGENKEEQTQTGETNTTTNPENEGQIGTENDEKEEEDETGSETDEEETEAGTGTGPNIEFELGNENEDDNEDDTEGEAEEETNPGTKTEGETEAETNTDSDFWPEDETEDEDDEVGNGPILETKPDELEGTGQDDDDDYSENESGGVASLTGSLRIGAAFDSFDQRTGKQLFIDSLSSILGTDVEIRVINIREGSVIFDFEITLSISNDDSSKTSAIDELSNYAGKIDTAINDNTLSGLLGHPVLDFQHKIITFSPIQENSDESDNGHVATIVGIVIFALILAFIGAFIYYYRKNAKGFQKMKHESPSIVKSSDSESDKIKLFTRSQPSSTSDLESNKGKFKTPLHTFKF